MKNSYYFNSNISIEEIKETFYNNVLNASLEGDENLLLKTFNLASFNNIVLDLSYQDGLIPVLAAQKGNDIVLKMLCNYDKTLIPTYGVEMLSHAASHGQIKCVNFLLEQKVNPLELKGTTSYNNYEDIEKLFDNHLLHSNLESEVKYIGDNLTDTLHNESH